MNFNGLITIEKAIVHILKPKDNYHKLSEYEIETDEKLNNLIIKHINTSIKHDTRRFSKFNVGENLLRDSSIQILNDNNKFVDESKKISRELFRSMGGTNASAANFLIAKYCHGEQSAIALLKLDFNDNFYTEEAEKDGKVKIEVKLKDAGFHEKQRLQKCAFVYDDIVSDANSNIIILDKQAKDDVSNYFGSTFLNSSLVNDDRANTTNMIDEVIKFINKKYVDNPKVLIDKTYSVTSYFKDNEEFEIDSMVNSVFNTEEIRNEFKEEIQNKNIDYSFNIDRNRVEKKFKSRHITTSNGIILKANASLFNSDNIDIGDIDENGLVDITIKKVKITENK
jgi:hypothetical protein